MGTSVNLDTTTHGPDVAEQMKSIRKARLRRQVFSNPELARELVKVESSAVYNTKGQIVQTVGSLQASV